MVEGIDFPRGMCYANWAVMAYAPVAQLDRVSDSDSEGHRFESCRVYVKTLESQGFPGLFLFFIRQGFERERPLSALRSRQKSGKPQRDAETARIHMRCFCFRVQSYDDLMVFRVTDFPDGLPDVFQRRGMLFISRVENSRILLKYVIFNRIIGFCAYSISESIFSEV